MKRCILRKWLIAVICMALIITAMPVTVLQVFAEGTEVGESEEDMGKNTEDMSGQGEQDNVLANDGATEEESGDNGIDDKPEKDDINEGEESESEKKDNLEENKSENEEDERLENTENNIEQEQDGIENNEEIDTVGYIIDEIPSTEEVEKITENKELMMASDNIANGSVTYDDQNYTWVIDANGKLLVKGENMCLKSGVQPWQEYCTQITSAEINVSGATRAEGMFEGCSNMTSVDFVNFDTSKITNMDRMFLGCVKLTDVDLSNFDTSSVTSMRSMFCSSGFTHLDLSSFNTSNVEYMDGMFSGCEELESLDLSRFNTENVVNMYKMFERCEKLGDLDVSSFRTGQVNDMSFMFQGCDNLKTLDLSNFNMENTWCSAMLDCLNLSTLYTPYNVTEKLELPRYYDAKWYLLDGTEVTEVPMNLGHSVVLIKNKEEVEDGRVQVVFNANGGSCDTEMLETDADGKIENFPTATFPGLIFGGWYTDTVFGDRVSSDTVFNDSIILYARYFEKNEIRYKDDMASFVNSFSYGLTDEDWNNYFSRLDRSSSIRIKKTYQNDYENKTNGVCFGVSSLVVKNKMGEFDPANYGANCFNDLNPKDNQKFTSILTVYQLSQDENAIKNEQKRFSKLSLENKLLEIIHRAEEVKEYGPAVFCFSFGRGNAHAIVIDGIEYGDFEVEGTTYYYKIKTWDINRKEGLPEYTSGGPKVYKEYPGNSYIYITKGLDAWTTEDLYSIKGEKQSGYLGKIHLISCYNINKITTAFEESKTEELEPMLFLNDAKGNTYSIDINGTETVIEDGMPTGNVDTGVYTVGDIRDGEDVSSSVTVFTPDNYESAVLTSVGNTAYSVMQASGYDLINVEVDNAKGLKLGQKVNTVQILENEGAYHFDLVKDGMSVNEVNIEGRSNGDITIQYIDEGFLLKSTGDNYVSINLNENNESVYENINEPDILIKDVQNTVKVYLDTDQNGDYETELRNEGDDGNSAGDSNTGDIGNMWQTSNRIDISDGISAGSVVGVETWKPTTPDEKKRYACMGKETIQYTLAKDNSYRLIIENAMQGLLCFNSFEAVLGDYMIGRTYNIYPYPTKNYSMSEEVQFTIKIPKSIYSPNRVYRMICVTQGGLPVIYEDLDTKPETITVRTNKFYAYALAYKEIVDTRK